ncbi:hydroxymethylbilane synthase [Meiothermus ruber]|uniref:Porphobilinogen deaminase n=1 Tax=Meiothermus ruber (strain ATCC 35948 / DSM 1279 / VKM B-1258 / 21) TaxID=504728 RepID=D3PRS7_MEIRD|nr:hydroxymethylbilane synthase [Meiothermus ruber]ADD28160.1 porphobilinogen deaminase [Meiothermus ruber DSM 1279]AGK04630.1 porphobilinogen deaminase [Meiothermus ruber DSM 1279]MCL6528870.1 hydroxymethylbilane synthase [Meiothermus ruber]
MGRVRIATRGSRLALWQAGWVQQQLERLGAQVELVVVETQGDRESRPFAQMQGQGFFTKAVQDAVLNWEADLAVHSFKDLPSARPEGLEIAAVPKREDPRELLLVRPEALDEAAPGLPLRSGALAGTSAARRQAQLRQLRPDLGLKELRGNVPTRVDKLRCGEYDAILLAYAGLKRLELDLSGLYTQVLPTTVLVPAPAQGALALECRSDDHRLKALLQPLDDPQARRTVEAERGLMQKLAGGCQLALGALAQAGPQGLMLLAWYGGRRYQAQAPTPEAVAQVVFDQIRAEHPEVVCESP